MKRDCFPQSRLFAMIIFLLQKPFIKYFSHEPLISLHYLKVAQYEIAQ